MPGVGESDALVPANDGDQFLDLASAAPLVAAPDGVADAALDVSPKDDLGRLAERGLHGGELMHQVDAVAVRVDHPLDRLHLAGDSAQPRTDGLLRRGVHHGCVSPGA